MGHERLQPESSIQGETVWTLGPEQFDELAPALSPDSRFLAYQSNESGDYQVFVQSFPAATGKAQVSTNGGGQPRWRRDGKELFYVEGDSLMAVPVTTEPSFTPGVPQRLFDAKGAFDGRGQRYDVSADGEKFVLVEPVQGEPSYVIRVVLNWYEEFRDREQD